MLVLGASFVSGCTTHLPGVPKGSITLSKAEKAQLKSLKKDCWGFREVNPTSKDIEVISEQLARGLLGNNNNGAAQCGWKPSK